MGFSMQHLNGSTSAYEMFSCMIHLFLNSPSLLPFLPYQVTHPIGHPISIGASIDNSLDLSTRVQLSLIEGLVAVFSQPSNGTLYLHNYRSSFIPFDVASDPSTSSQYQWYEHAFAIAEVSLLRVRGWSNCSYSSYSNPCIGTLPALVFVHVVAYAIKTLLVSVEDRFYVICIGSKCSFIVLCHHSCSSLLLYHLCSLCHLALRIRWWNLRGMILYTFYIPFGLGIDIRLSSDWPIQWYITSCAWRQHQVGKSARRHYYLDHCMISWQDSSSRSIERKAWGSTNDLYRPSHMTRLRMKEGGK